jgi:hypothetical protein
MKAQTAKKRPNLSTQSIFHGDLNQELDALLTLDRRVLEFSMRIYKVSRRDRLMIRKQNRRLHDAVRQHLPRAVAAGS